MISSRAKVVRNKEIARRRANGELIKTLAAAYDLSPTVIRKIAARWGAPKHLPRPTFDLRRRSDVRPEWSRIDHDLMKLCHQIRREMETADPYATPNKITDEGEYIK